MVHALYLERNVAAEIMDMDQRVRIIVENIGHAEGHHVRRQTAARAGRDPVDDAAVLGVAPLGAQQLQVATDGGLRGLMPAP